VIDNSIERQYKFYWRTTVQYRAGNISSIYRVSINGVTLPVTRLSVIIFLQYIRAVTIIDVILSLTRSL